MSARDPEDPKKTIRLAVDNAKPVKARAKAEKAPPAAADRRPATTEESADGGFYGPPDTLPDEAPVKALGKKGRTYYFLDSIGQLIELKASEIGRNDILSLFGGDHYLIKTWPEVDQHGVPKKHRWQHQLLSPLLIAACTRRGLWDPLEKVRGPGGWCEEDGTIVMHCGDVLWVGKDRTGTGLRGSLLYPRSPKLPEPIFGAAGGATGPGAALLDQIETWNWARGDIDAKLLVGWMGAAMLGAGPEWRPQAWLTSSPGAGKSTLQLLVRWTLGAGGYIKSEETTPAAVSQLAAQSSLPVSLDELEAKANNTKVQEIIELMRIASSGGSKARGGQDGKTAVVTQLHNCFLASSVLLPPLKPQDKSRIVVLSLRPFVKRDSADAGELVGVDDEEAEENTILGRRARWERVGREMRGRLIAEWPRYRKTFRAFRRALVGIGHDARAADQFGALGAAFDCVMHDGFEDLRATAWAAMLPPSSLAETAVQLSEERECLAHLLAHLLDLFRNGEKENVAHYLRMARRELLEGKKGDNLEAARVLEKIGIRIWRDAQYEALRETALRAGEKRKADDHLFWIGISHTHGALAGIFHGTHWKGEAGAAGTWAQALSRLPDAHSGPNVKRRFDGVAQYVTCLPWEVVFPPMEAEEEADMAPADRRKE